MPTISQNILAIPTTYSNVTPRPPRTRTPDVVETWDDTEVARRWLMLCPVRKTADGKAAEPSEPALSSIRFEAD